ncbi:MULTISPECIES: hypothetical protein [unclassified Streptomyces]|uniref:hypothetical protein n=1 Tax=Streptomyces sp. NPDC127129 TaxID=3345373 RepID=UPI003641D8AB
MSDAAARADQRVGQVRDDVAGRIALAQEFYATASEPVRRYGRAELSFLRWTAARGVLASESADPSGSPWWRAVNEGLLRDKVEAGILSTAKGTGVASARSVEYWLEFVRAPSPAHWYRAHNASIVSGYLRHAELAGAELQVERFMMNVALLRVLFTHAMLVKPRLALGRMARLGPQLVDPRHRTVKLFLDLGRSFPSEYPLIVPTEETILDEHALARMLDYGMIAPRLPALYEFSAHALEEPRLENLLDAGLPAYAWPREDRSIWYIGNTGAHLGAIARASGVRLNWERSPATRTGKRRSPR